MTTVAPKPAAWRPAWLATPRPKNTCVGMQNSPSAATPAPRRASAGWAGGFVVFMGRLLSAHKAGPAGHGGIPIPQSAHTAWAAIAPAASRPGTPG